jgi:hypothetical protein
VQARLEALFEHEVNSAAEQVFEEELDRNEPAASCRLLRRAVRRAFKALTSVLGAIIVL